MIYLMLKKTVSVFLFFSILISMVFATPGDVVTEEEQKAMETIIDCVSSAFVSEYSTTRVTLPCTSIVMDQELDLPQRISFFLADPADFVQEMSKYTTSNGNVLVSILSIFNKTSSDPFLSAMYLLLTSKGYEQNEYLINGSIAFKYLQGTTIEQLSDIWISRKADPEEVLPINMNLVVYGKGLVQPVSISGSFMVFIDEQGLINIKPDDFFLLDGKEIRDVIFKF